MIKFIKLLSSNLGRFYLKIKNLEWDFLSLFQCQALPLSLWFTSEDKIFPETNITFFLHSLFWIHAFLKSNSPTFLSQRQCQIIRIYQVKQIIQALLSVWLNRAELTSTWKVSQNWWVTHFWTRVSTAWKII